MFSWIKFFIFFLGKNPLWKNFLYFALKNLIKFLLKFFWVTFIIYWLFKHLVFKSPFFPQTQSVRTPLTPYHSLCSACVTYETPCHVIGHQVLPTQPFLGKQKFSLGVASSLIICLCSRSLLNCNQFNQSAISLISLILDDIYMHQNHDCFYLW